MFLLVWMQREAYAIMMSIISFSCSLAGCKNNQPDYRETQDSLPWMKGCHAHVVMLLTGAQNGWGWKRPLEMI